MNKKLLIGIGSAAILVILATLLGKYIGYDIGYESAVKDNQDWKLYENDKYGFSFEYPKEWLSDEPYKQQSSLLDPATHQPAIDPRIIEVISPEHNKQLDDIPEGPFRGIGSLVDFRLIWCEDINSNCADEYWQEGKTYRGIEDLLADERSYKKRSSFMPSVDVGGTRGYGVILPNFHNNPPAFYQVMVDYKGIYILEFPSFWPGEDQDLTPEQRHILSSFKFTN